MRRLLPCLLLLLAAAGAPDPLRTAVDGTFAPHAMPKLAGGLQGFNIDLAQAIARQLGRPIHFDALNATALIPGLDAGKYDFIAAPWTVTPERAATLLFTEPYLDTNLRFATRQDGLPMAGLEDLRGRVLAVNKGSFYETWAQANQAKYGFTIQGFATEPDAIAAVVNGHADANLAASTVILWTSRTTPQIHPGYEIATGQYWAIPVRHGDAAMRDRIDLAIKCLKRSGELGRIAAQWFGPQSPDAASMKTFPGRGTPGFPGWDPTPQPGTC